MTARDAPDIPQYDRTHRISINRLSMPRTSVRGVSILQIVEAPPFRAGRNDIAHSENWKGENA